jgi:hypothetical protein
MFVLHVLAPLLAVSQFVLTNAKRYMKKMIGFLPSPAAAMVGSPKIIDYRYQFPSRQVHAVCLFD